ncbi:hypothetical protein TNCV_1952811 [Trichonephila clavipes]|nr:hypothetical protein TNCV_1952811 [Trichonephila clavipes]
MNKLGKFQEIGCSMSAIIQFIYSHVDFSLENIILVSEEEGEIFYQGIKDMERGMDMDMLADSCWILNQIGLRLNEKEERQKEVSKGKENVPKEKLC